MTDLSTNNKHELEKLDDTNDTTWGEPNLKGEWMNIFVLTVLYTLQGFTFGLSMTALPIIFQNKKMVTYYDQVNRQFFFFIVSTIKWHYINTITFI